MCDRLGRCGLELAEKISENSPTVAEQ